MVLFLFFGATKSRKKTISIVYKVPGTSLSPGRLKWVLLVQRTELEV